MAKTIDELKAQSAEVKNATSVGENTATRVGTLFNDIVEYIEQVPANGAVTTEKLAPIAVTAEKIANGTVTTEKLADSVRQAIIYDVSSHNDGAVFESISALLSSSNLSTLIPTSVRHGGMTIRFIQGSEQGSDNKYVQYRLMADSWSTAIGDWQGVDDEPIAESKNLVESGGVCKMFANLSEYFSLKTPSVERVDGYVYVNNQGTISAGNIHRGIYYFPVQKGDIVRFSTKNNNSSILTAAAIAVTSDTIPVVGSSVLEYQYWSDIYEVDAFYVVKNTGTLYYYVYLPNNQTTSCKVIESITNTLLPVEKTAGIAYFTLGYSPTFSDITNGIKVKLPNTGVFRIYSPYKGKLVEFSFSKAQAGAEFELTNLKSLVLDFDDNTFKVVDTGTVGNYATMLSYTSKNAVDGLFKQYYYAQTTNKVNTIESKDNVLQQQIGSGYINLGYAPTFKKITDGIHIAFPHKGYSIRVFNPITGTMFDKNIDDTDITGYDLTNAKSLVADIDDNKTLKVVDSSAVGNYVVLLTYVSSEAVDGIFKPYYDVWERNRILNGEQFNLIKYWRENFYRANITKQINQGDFKALFFSDIHGNETALSRIIQLANNVWRNNINAVIDAGDDTQSYQTLTNLDWYNTLAATCAKPIIRAVGNHDAWVNSYWDWATPQQVYEYFTAPAVALMQTKGLTVVQPSDAATAYRNYYYIDFGNIRVIVLLSLTMEEDNRYYDNDQDTWFKSVLSDALTNSKSVICVNHGPLNPNSCNQVESNWSSFKKWNTIADNQHVDDAAVAAVDGFIDNGGTFICWLSGHAHIDYLLTSNTGTHKQFCFTTACAKNGTMYGLQPNSLNDAYYDLLNFLSVDLTNNLVKVWRIGFNNNYALQEHNTFCWNYVEEKLVSET